MLRLLDASGETATCFEGELAGAWEVGVVSGAGAISAGCGGGGWDVPQAPIAIRANAAIRNFTLFEISSLAVTIALSPRKSSSELQTVHRPSPQRPCPRFLKDWKGLRPRGAVFYSCYAESLGIGHRSSSATVLKSLDDSYA